MEIVFGGTPRINAWSPLFNIFLADLIIIVDSMDTANYADDDTPYATANDIDSLIRVSLKVFICLV